MNFTIEATTEKIVLAECAEMMSRTDPWITLQRDLGGCMEAMLGSYKEVYIARRNRELLGFIVLQMQVHSKDIFKASVFRPMRKTLVLAQL